MKPSSAKGKGRRLQDEIVKVLHEAFPTLEAGDIKPAIMGESGLDIKLSPAARRKIPFDIEAKNVERLNIWNAWKQAVANTAPGRIPLVVFRKNRHERLACIRLDDLLDLQKRAIQKG